MTAFERFEREIPSLMDEIAPPRLPDYFDDMLRQTGRTRQRPAWASLERWLPMDVVARPVPVRAPALRPLLILLLIGLLIAGGLVLYAGTQRTRLPEPFGLARNGVIVISTTDRDIAAYDPVSGMTTTLIGGATKDIAPAFSRDGQRFMFVRLVSGEYGAYWVANADGTDARELVRAPVEWVDWSDAGDRIVTTRLLGGPTETSVIDVGSGEATVLDVGGEIQHPHWRPGHDQIVFKTSPDGIQSTYYLVNADGSESHVIDGVSPYAVNDPAFSPDGSKMAYASWQIGGKELRTQGRIHVLDLDSGTDQLLMFDGSEGTHELDPQFSPDGTTLLFERYDGQRGRISTRRRAA